MNITSMSLEEVRQCGLDALAWEPGPTRMVRFLQQFETGSGDYSTDRDGWLTQDLASIQQQMRSE